MSPVAERISKITNSPILTGADYSQEGIGTFRIRLKDPIDIAVLFNMHTDAVNAFGGDNVKVFSEPARQGLQDAAIVFEGPARQLVADGQKFIA